MPNFMIPLFEDLKNKISNKTKMLLVENPGVIHLSSKIYQKLLS